MRILAVDDQPLFIAIIRDTLEPRGYALSYAATAQACLKALSRERFDLLLLDRWLGEVDGVELMRGLRSRLEYRDMPIVLQTSSSSPAAVKEGLDAGAFYYLTKPYAADVLVAVVEAALADAARIADLRSQVAGARQASKLLKAATLEFSTLGEAEAASRLLAEAFADPHRVITGLTELCVNAIEHGNLGLSYEDKSRLLPQGRWQETLEARAKDPVYSTRKARAEFRCTDELTWVRITDEGAGFDWTRYLDFDPARAGHAHGRGIALARMVSFDEVHFLGRGNQVEATVRRAPAPDSPARERRRDNPGDAESVLHR